MLLDKEKKYELPVETTALKRVNGFQMGKFSSDVLYGSEVSPILFKEMNNFH